MDRAVLSNEERMALTICAAINPIGTGVQLGGIILSQAIAMRMAAEAGGFDQEDED